MKFFTLGSYIWCMQSSIITIFLFQSSINRMRTHPLHFTQIDSRGLDCEYFRQWPVEKITFSIPQKCVLSNHCFFPPKSFGVFSAVRLSLVACRVNKHVNASPSRKLTASSGFTCEHSLLRQMRDEDGANQIRSGLVGYLLTTGGQIILGIGLRKRIYCTKIQTIMVTLVVIFCILFTSIILPEFPNPGDSLQLFAYILYCIVLY